MKAVLTAYTSGQTTITKQLTTSPTKNAYWQVGRTPATQHTLCSQTRLGPITNISKTLKNKLRPKPTRHINLATAPPAKAEIAHQAKAEAKAVTKAEVRIAAQAAAKAAARAKEIPIPTP